MKEVFIMLAKALSKDQCIERIEEAISNYKEAKLLNKGLENSENTLNMAAHLLILNSMDESPVQIIKDIEEIERSHNFFKTAKN
jgi:ribosomal protein L7Ae-like RNA K-turn-binding protein